MSLAVIVDETHVIDFTNVVRALEIAPKLDVVVLSLALVAATLGDGLFLPGRRHVFYWCLDLARFHVHVHRLGVRDRGNLRFIEPPEAAYGEGHTPLCLRLSLHDGVSEGVALEPGDAHGSDGLVRTPVTILGAGRYDVDTIVVHLSAR